MALREAEEEERTDETKDKLKQDTYEVIIVGGGPAGIATAITLNALGVSNCVIEASNEPSRKYGEALPPNAKPLLRQLGILSLVEDHHHQEYYGNQSCWGSDQLEQKEFYSEIHGCGYLLDRLYFEKQLWTVNQNADGTLLTSSKLRKVARTDSGFSVSIHQGENLVDMKCQFIVDATGRKASVCRMLGHSKINLDSQFAFSFTLELEKSIQNQIIVEATQNGWWYIAPDDKDKIAVMFFTLKEILPNKENEIEFLLKELNTSIHISDIISIDMLCQAKVKITPCGTNRLESSYGDHWIAVGDASFSYDPISSYGITSALASGYYAGQALASKIAGKEEAMDAYRFIVENAFQAYTEKLFAHYNLEQRWKDSFYWKNRFSQ